MTAAIPDRDSRRVLISGGTSGIGYACAERLAARGEAALRGLTSTAEFHLAVNASQRVRRQGWLADDRSRGGGEGGWPSRRLPESG